MSWEALVAFVGTIGLIIKEIKKNFNEKKDD